MIDQVSSSTSELTTTYQYILTNISEGILTITLNRPDKLNALRIALVSEIKNALQEHQYDENVKGVIVTGSGKKAFAAGADISEFADFDAMEAITMAASGHSIMDYIETYPKPIIAAVNGFALGGGCELAMACHLRLASENALFGQPEVKLGIIPGYGGTQRLIQLIGKGKAFELLMTGDNLSATEALSLGLVNAVVPQEELLDKCKAILHKIGKRGPIAIRKVIHCVNAHFAEGVDGFKTEVTSFGQCFDTTDAKEGIAAFVEKRKAIFKGE